MASFGLYNGLVGYLILHRETMGLASLAFFTVAMALHFVVTDYGLNEDHKAAYRRTGRGSWSPPSSRGSSSVRSRWCRTRPSPH